MSLSTLLPRAKVPEDLRDSFKALLETDRTVCHYVDRVSKRCKSGQGFKERVLVVSHDALCLCTERGDIKRITRVTELGAMYVDKSSGMFALSVPSEYDMTLKSRTQERACTIIQLLYKELSNRKLPVEALTPSVLSSLRVERPQGYVNDKLYAPIAKAEIEQREMARQHSLVARKVTQPKWATNQRGSVGGVVKRRLSPAPSPLQPPSPVSPQVTDTKDQDPPAESVDPNSTIEQRIKDFEGRESYSRMTIDVRETDARVALESARQISEEVLKRNIEETRKATDAIREEVKKLHEEKEKFVKEREAFEAEMKVREQKTQAREDASVRQVEEYQQKEHSEAAVQFKDTSTQSTARGPSTSDRSSHHVPQEEDVRGRAMPEDAPPLRFVPPIPPTVHSEDTPSAPPPGLSRTHQEEHHSQTGQIQMDESPTKLVIPKLSFSPKVEVLGRRPKESPKPTPRTPRAPDEINVECDVSFIANGKITTGITSSVQVRCESGVVEMKFSNECIPKISAKNITSLMVNLEDGIVMFDLQSPECTSLLMEFEEVATARAITSRLTYSRNDLTADALCSHHLKVKGYQLDLRHRRSAAQLPPQNESDEKHVSRATVAESLDIATRATVHAEKWVGLVESQQFLWKLLASEVKIQAARLHRIISEHRAQLLTRLRKSEHRWIQLLTEAKQVTAARVSLKSASAILLKCANHYEHLAEVDKATLKELGFETQEMPNRAVRDSIYRTGESIQRLLAITDNIFIEDCIKESKLVALKIKELTTSTANIEHATESLDDRKCWGMLVPPECYCSDWDAQLACMGGELSEVDAMTALQYALTSVAEEPTNKRRIISPPVDETAPILELESPTPKSSRPTTPLMANIFEQRQAELVIREGCQLQLDIISSLEMAEEKSDGIATCGHILQSIHSCCVRSARSYKEMIKYVDRFNAKMKARFQLAQNINQAISNYSKNCITVAQILAKG